MGRRSPTESVARIYSAFLREKTWTQADLAREVGIGVQALRKRLDELTTLGMPLQAEEDRPHVYWSVPNTWFPGGAFLKDEDLPSLLHVLWHTPRGRRRDRLLRLVLGSTRDHPDAAAAGMAILTPDTSEAEEAFLPIVEEAIVRRQVVRMRFYSTKRGEVETRHVSVHRVDVGPPTRLIATCHRDGRLKWFRVDNIVDARSDSNTSFRSETDVAIERFRAESIDGFREVDEVEEHVFFIRDPEATWAVNSLLAPMRHERTDGGIVVTVRTAGALRVARYVAGLGGAATARTARLRMVVKELAEGALRNAGASGKLPEVQKQTDEQVRRRANR